MFNCRKCTLWNSRNCFYSNFHLFLLKSIFDCHMNFRDKFTNRISDISSVFLSERCFSLSLLLQQWCRSAFRKIYCMLFREINGFSTTMTSAMRPILPSLICVTRVEKNRIKSIATFRYWPSILICLVLIWFHDKCILRIYSNLKNYWNIFRNS